MNNESIIDRVVLAAFRKSINSEDFFCASKILLLDILKLNKDMVKINDASNMTEILKLVFQTGFDMGYVSGANYCVKRLKELTGC